MMPGARVAILHLEVKMRMDALHIKKQKNKVEAWVLVSWSKRKETNSILFKPQLFPVFYHSHPTFPNNGEYYYHPHFIDEAQNI